MTLGAGQSAYITIPFKVKKQKEAWRAADKDFQTYSKPKKPDKK
jgi:hypothetical protein